jgi:hypothetical protein
VYIPNKKALSMKTKNLILTAIFMLSTISCQAIGLTSALVGTVVVVPVTYIIYKHGQANGNSDKAWRLIRQDKDYAITKTQGTVNSHCSNEKCQALVEFLQQFKSTDIQLTKDALQKNITEPVKKAFDDTCNNGKKFLDELGKSKK